MSSARCRDCGAVVHWFSYRGSKLKDARCYHCGGKLDGMTRGQRRAKPWGPLLSCVACGKRGYLGRGLLPVAATSWYLGYAPAGASGGPFPPGPACWIHEVREMPTVSRLADFR